MYVFHLNTHAANKQLDVMFDGFSIKHVNHPKNLGVTLDRTLTFKSHLEKAAKKVSSRVNLVRKLAG
jgi:DNA-directed RNA polymerase subunit L